MQYNINQNYLNFIILTLLTIFLITKLFVLFLKIIIFITSLSVVAYKLEADLSVTYKFPYIVSDLDSDFNKFSGSSGRA